MKEGLYESKKHHHNCLVAVGARGNITITYNNTIESSCSSCSSSNSVKDKWHKKLGHRYDQVLSHVLQLCNVKWNRKESFFCEPCQSGKMHALPFNLSISHAKTPLELVHTDVYYTFSFKYNVQFLDDYSRHSWIYPLGLKVKLLVHLYNLKF